MNRYLCLLAMAVWSMTALHVFSMSGYTVDWTKTMGTPRSDLGHELAIDKTGNVYIVGVSHGANNTNARTQYDTFITKFTGDGEVLWTTSINSGDEFNDQATTIALDDFGMVFVAGSTTGALQGINHGLSDVFVSKLHTSGEMIWTRQLGTNTMDIPTSVVVDRQGNAIVSGTTGGKLGQHAFGNSDVFLASLTTNGETQWVTQYGGDNYDNGGSLQIGDDGTLHVAGTTWGNLGGAHQGSGDVLWMQFNEDGGFLQSRQFGSSLNDPSVDLVIDSFGDALIAGLSYNSGLGSVHGQGYLANVSPDVGLQWQNMLGPKSTSEYSGAAAVAIDPMGTTWVVNWTLKPGPGRGSYRDFTLFAFDVFGNQVEELELAEGDLNARIEYLDLGFDDNGNMYLVGYVHYGIQSSVDRSMTGFDDLVLIKLTRVPEPSSILLLAGGLVFLLQKLTPDRVCLLEHTTVTK